MDEDDREVSDAADWVTSGLRGSSQSVLSMVPVGFEAYARIFHPARMSKPVAVWADVFAGRERPWRTVRWAEIATANGRRVGPLMQMEGLTGSRQLAMQGQSGLFDQAPARGQLEENTARGVVEVLRRHTTTPSECFFGVWEGSNSLPDDVASRAPTFSLPNRWLYYLLEGPLEHLLTAQPIHMAWPRDHAWCLGTHVDFDSSYVGGKSACVRDMLASLELEAFEVEPGDPIQSHTDPLNPPSRP